MRTDPLFSLGLWPPRRTSVRRAGAFFDPGTEVRDAGVPLIVVIAATPYPIASDNAQQFCIEPGLVGDDRTTTISAADVNGSTECANHIVCDGRPGQGSTASFARNELD